MRIFPPFARMLLAGLLLAVLATACAASPTITVTREPTAAELAAEVEADRTFAATPAYLARVKAVANDVDSVRFELFTTIDSSLLSMGSRTEPVISGEQAGNRSRIAMDMGRLMGPAAGMLSINRNALTMTMVTEGSVTYLNAPFFAEIMSAAGISTSEYPWVTEIVAGWGRIDTGASSSGLLSDMGMNGGAGAEEMLALLDTVAGEVLDGGAGEVRGVPVRIAHTSVSIVDVLEQSGQSMSEMGIDGREADALRELAANIAVYIDDEGRVMRLEYTMNLSGITDVDPQAADLDLQMWQRVDFFDHGGDIEIPVPLTWTDITDDFEDLLDEIN